MSRKASAWASASEKAGEVSARGRDSAACASIGSDASELASGAGSAAAWASMTSATEPSKTMRGSKTKRKERDEFWRAFDQERGLCFMLLTLKVKRISDNPIRSCTYMITHSP